MLQSNQKQELPKATMFVVWLGRNENVAKDLSQMLPVKYKFIWPSGFRLEDFSILANQKQEYPIAVNQIQKSLMVAKFVKEIRMKQENFIKDLISIDASCEISVQHA